jgi:hypothetical protein
MPTSSNKRPMCDPAEWVIVLHLPDVVRVVFRLAPDEDEQVALSETAVRHLQILKSGATHFLSASHL